MRFFSLIAYIITIVLFYLCMKMLEGTHFSIMNFWDLSSFIFIFSGIVLLLVNFKLSEIINAVKNAVSNKNTDLEKIIFDKKLIQVSWRNILSVIAFSCILVMVIIFSNVEDTSKLGPYLATMLISPLYALMIKFFFLMPLEISLEKKLILSQKEDKINFPTV